MSKRQKRRSPDDVIGELGYDPVKAFCMVTGFEPADILGSDRRRMCAWARYMIAHTMSELGLHDCDISVLLKRDMFTVRKCAQQHRKKVEASEEYRGVYSLFKQMLIAK